MPAYLVGHVTMKDPVAYAEYGRQVAPLIARFGGRYLIRGGAAQAVEGTPFNRVVVVEFADMAALKAFYFSPEYAPLIALRQRAADGDVSLVEGYAG
jgi:uncharacterized protein (DUF1330 family)